MQIEDTVEGSRQAKGTNGAVHVYSVNAADHIDTANGVAVYEQGQFGHDFVAASTSRALGGTGAVGDFLHKLIIFPATADPGAITLADGNTTARTILPATSGLDSLQPIVIEFNMVCTVATTPGWRLVTGTNASVWAIGRFTA